MYVFDWRDVLYIKCGVIGIKENDSNEFRGPSEQAWMAYN